MWTYRCRSGACRLPENRRKRHREFHWPMRRLWSPAAEAWAAQKDSRRWLRDWQIELGAAVASDAGDRGCGWRPYSEQVGQTGKTVQPKAYIAIGISGAVQHLSGMGKSKCIVAINKDADAPIFKVADYGIVGDVNQIVPAMIAAIRK